MARFGLVGPSYPCLSPNADAEETINFFTSLLEAEGKSKMMLEPTAGLKAFATIPNAASVRGEFKIQSNATERGFAVIGTSLYEVKADGSTSKYVQAIVDDGQPVYFATGPNGSAGAGGVWQLLFCSGGTAYVLDLTAVAPAGITVIPAASFNNSVPVSQVAYVDGFFLALLANTNQFQVSALLNALDWTSAAAPGAAGISVFTDNAFAMVANDRLLCFLGPKQSVWYQNVGDPNFPFQVIPGSLIEEGCGASNSWSKIANDIFFLGADERGGGIVRRMTGYTPTRISNQAVELSIQSMAKFSDSIGWSYQDRGHTFYVLYFPSGGLSWAYDLTTQQWHKKQFWNVLPGTYSAHLGRCHMYAFGKHLVGDRQSGTIYDMSQNYLDDAGTVIRRLRRAPHVSTEQEWEFHKQLQIDVEVGIGPTLLDANGKPREPQMFLRWSDDGGHAWGNYHVLGCGLLGQYKRRVLAQRLGKSRDRVYEISMTDPISWRIVDAYLKSNPTNRVTPSRQAQLRGMGI